METKDNPIIGMLKGMAIAAQIAETIGNGLVELKKAAVSPEGQKFLKAVSNNLKAKKRPVLASLVEGTDAIIIAVEEEAETLMRKDLDGDGKVGGG